MLSLESSEMNIPGQRSTEIPGLFSSITDQSNSNVDWSNDTVGNDRLGANPAADSGPANNQNQTSMILLGGKTLLTDLTMEKDNLDQGYSHAHRLLNTGKDFVVKSN